MAHAANIERGVWLVLAAAMTALLVSGTAAADTALPVGYSMIGISGELAGSTVEKLRADCQGIVEAFVFDATVQSADNKDKIIPVYLKGEGSAYAAQIRQDMAGKGLIILNLIGCALKAKSFSDQLGEAAKLQAGSNIISVTNSLVRKSLDDVKGACGITKAWLYLPDECSKAEAKCQGYYLPLSPTEKLSESHKGKGLLVKAQSACVLDDKPKAEAPSCSEAECSAKTACYGTELQTYGCKDNKCEIITRATCKGVDLVPRVDVKMQGQTAGQGDAIQFDIYVKNNGDTSTYQHAIDKKESSYVISFSLENTETGAKVKQEYKTVNSVDADKNVPAGGETKLATYAWSAVEGKYKVRVKVDSNNEMTEAQGGEANNEIVAGLDGKAYEAGKNELVIGSMSTNLPDLVVVKSAVSISPKLLCRPSVVKAMSAKIKNNGNAPAVAEGHGLEIKVSIREVSQDGSSKIVCSNDNPNDLRRLMTTIEAGKEEAVSDLGLKTAGGGDCGLLPGKDYHAVVEADTFAIGANPVGVVQESDEKNNAVVIPLVDETACSKIGERIGNCYCSLDKKPLTQVVPYQACAHNFECKYEFCVKGKCVTQEQKDRILAIVG